MSRYFEQTRSPLAEYYSASQAASAHPHRSELRCTDEGRFYFLERRADSDGSTALVEIRAQTTCDVLPPGISVRTRVHEYGGGSYCLGKGSIYYVEEQSQQVFEHSASGESRQLSAQLNARFADMVECLSLGLLICVRETHSKGRIVNELVGISLRDGVNHVLASGGNRSRTI